MTFTELKDRIVSTLYLPVWLRSGITEVTPTTVVPVIEPMPEGSPKWCPFVRSTSVHLKEDGIQSVSKQSAKNRTTYIGKKEDGTIGVVGASIQIAYCIGERCQMWNGQDCGMKSPAMEFKLVMEDLYERMKAEQELTSP